MRKQYYAFYWLMQLVCCIVAFQFSALSSLASYPIEPARSSCGIQVALRDSLHPHRSDERESADSSVGLYHLYLLPLDLIRTDFTLLEIGGDIRIGDFATLGVSLAYSSRLTGDDDIVRMMVNTDVYLSGDAYTSSLVLSPFISLRRLRGANYAGYVIPERFAAGAGSFVGYRHFYTMPSKDKISMSLMLGASVGRQVGGVAELGNGVLLNLYFRLALGYVFADASR